MTGGTGEIITFLVGAGIINAVGVYATVKMLGVKIEYMERDIKRLDDIIERRGESRT